MSCLLSIHTIKVRRDFTGSHACLPCCLFSNTEHQKYYSGQTKNRCKVCWTLHLDLQFIHVFLLLALKGSKAIIGIYSKTFHLTWHRSAQKFLKSKQYPGYGHYACNILTLIFAWTSWHAWCLNSLFSHMYSNVLPSYLKEKRTGNEMFLNFCVRCSYIWRVNWGKGLGNFKSACNSEISGLTKRLLLHQRKLL